MFFELAVRLPSRQRSFPSSTASAPGVQGSVNRFFFPPTDAEQPVINHTVTGSYSDEKSKLSIIYISKLVRHLQYGFNS